MLRRTKLKIIRWVRICIPLVFLALIVWANFVRLNDNLYPNYEKAVDYGRVREVKTEVAPIIAAIFYADKNIEKKNISTYFDHSENYRKQNVKIVVVPRNLTADSIAVAEKLYEEIGKYNKFKKVAIVYDNNTDIKKHQKILQKVLKIDRAAKIKISETDFSNEKKIDKLLRKENSVVIFLADLVNGIDNQNSDYLVEEAVYFAQKYAYNIHVFDVIDTQIARALEQDYATLFKLPADDEIAPMMKQKNNLTAYLSRYGDELLRYFEMNLLQSEKPIWPQKNAQTYRLFDRGMIYVRIFDEQKREIFSRANIKENQSVLVSLVNIAIKASKKINQTPKSWKIHLLTDFEKISPQQLQNREHDDGICVRRGKKYALLLPDEMSDNPQVNLAILLNRANISKNESLTETSFFKFKNVEISDEN